ncbi:hypothetical protein HOLleu_26644 [Holothuria leucospilota]|uniref:Uncharacterized protein n=1 Tax=Holothuria leucospilota TaxID=206669 RepID=A0A9Q1BPA5_HOLLE|nr:hypothetical protein HOLleu_26644 [Holothuria leucospilota]
MACDSQSMDDSKIMLRVYEGIAVHLTPPANLPEPSDRVPDELRKRVENAKKRNEGKRNKRESRRKDKMEKKGEKPLR